ncbi:MAG: HupE/UreJ family protein [Enhygromyxa sp.]
MKARWLGLLAVLLLACLLSPRAQAHEFRPALLRLEQRSDDPGRYDLRLVTPKVSASGPIGPGELTPIAPAHCELRERSEIAFTIECGEQGLVGELGIDGLERHPLDVLVEVRYADATRFVGVLGPDQPTLTLGGAEEQARRSVFSDYLLLGVEHILIGLDHLLFVLGLVLLVRAGSRSREPLASGRDPAIRRLLWTVTAFTLAHSVTLAASTLELVTLPSAPVEAGIALSIVLLARELALGSDLDGQDTDTLTWRYPWLVAFLFGLLHGFGFAGALHEIGLPPSQAPLALLAFNLGVEAGQLGVVAILLLSFTGLRWGVARMKLSSERESFARKLPIWLMGGVAVAWTFERVLGFWGG